MISKRTAIVMMTIPVVLWIFIQVLHPYCNLVWTVRWKIGFNRLQESVIPILDHPPQQFGNGPQGVLRNEDLPEEIRFLSEHGFVIYDEGDVDNESDDHILVACGGGFYRYGLWIGRPGTEQPSQAGFSMHRLSDGIWGMTEQ